MTDPLSLPVWVWLLVMFIAFCSSADAIRLQLRHRRSSTMWREVVTTLDRTWDLLPANDYDAQYDKSVLPERVAKLIADRDAAKEALTDERRILTRYRGVVTELAEVVEGEPFDGGRLDYMEHMASKWCARELDLIEAVAILSEYDALVINLLAVAPKSGKGPNLRRRARLVEERFWNHPRFPHRTPAEVDEALEQRDVIECAPPVEVQRSEIVQDNPTAAALDHVAKTYGNIEAGEVVAPMLIGDVTEGVAYTPGGMVKVIGSGTTEPGEFVQNGDVVDLRPDRIDDEHAPHDGHPVH